MAQLDESLDVANMDLGGFDLLPKGWYLAQVIESEMAPTKTGGRMVKATFEVLDGEARGRKVWANYTWTNSNPEAQRIGRQQLGRLASCVGVEALGDTEELHFRPLMIKVGVREGTGEYRDQNVISDCKPHEGVAPVQPARREAPRQEAAQQRQSEPSQQRPAGPSSTGAPQPRPTGSRPWGQQRA